MSRQGDTGLVFGHAPERERARAFVCAHSPTALVCVRPYVSLGVISTTTRCHRCDRFSSSVHGTAAAAAAAVDKAEPSVCQLPSVKSRRVERKHNTQRIARDCSPTLSGPIGPFVSGHRATFSELFPTASTVGQLTH